MNSTRFSLALILLVTLAAFTMAQEDACTPATCVGLVQKDWDGYNCQGEPLVIHQSITPGNENVCTVSEGGGSYSRMAGTKDGYAFFAYFNGSTCSAESFSTSQSYRIGQCFNSVRRSSYVFLASVNDTFTAPGTPDPTTTPINEEYIECYSANNCTSDIPIYTTYYDSNTCEPSTAYQSSGLRVSANFSYGECFLKEDGLYTVKYSCDGANYRVDYYQNGACAGLPYTSAIQTTSCTRPFAVAKKEGDAVSYHRITCPAAPPTVVPTSSGLSIYETSVALVLTGMTSLLSLLL